MMTFYTSFIIERRSFYETPFFPLLYRLYSVFSGIARTVLSCEVDGESRISCTAQCMKNRPRYGVITFVIRKVVRTYAF